MCAGTSCVTGSWRMWGHPFCPWATSSSGWATSLNGELYGPPADLPWGVEFPASLGPVHPTQLYEVAAALVILPFAWRWAAKPKYHGYAFFRTLFIHSLVRFFLDFLRQHSQLYGPFVLSQIIALAICLVTLPIIIILDRRQQIS